ncbi:MAG: hypothetical protein IID18_10135, partial [Nitrospinae bacterium]|nr:hypothetical protein [Nitrospinota bacterium]
DLRDVPEIRWVKVDKKNIVIGWKGIPSNFPMINRTAAVNANKAVGYLIHVWSVRHTQKKWTIGTKPYLCKTVAERRRIQQSACRF